MSQLLTQAGPLASIAAVATALVTLAVWSLRRLVRLAKRIGYFLDDYYGQPARDGVAAVPGVMSRLQSLDAHRIEVRAEVVKVAAEQKQALAAVAAESKAQFALVNRRLDVIQPQVRSIHHEMQPNEGNSMKDQMNRVDEAITANGGQSIKDQITRIDEATSE